MSLLRINGQTPTNDSGAGLRNKCNVHSWRIIFVVSCANLQNAALNGEHSKGIDLYFGIDLPYAMELLVCGVRF